MGVCGRLRTGALLWKKVIVMTLLSEFLNILNTKKSSRPQLEQG